MSDQLFREVDEEVRQERFQQVWKRYGIYAAAAVLVVVAVTVGYVVWTNLQESARVEASERFISIIESGADDPAAARAALESFAEDAPDGYALMARIRAAALAADNGDVDAAVSGFDAIAADSTVPELYRNLASLLAVSAGMSVMSYDEVAQRVGPLDRPDGPMRFSARELMAAAAIRAGESERAVELLEANTDDPAAPPGVRQRAAELLATLQS